MKPTTPLSQQTIQDLAAQRPEAPRPVPAEHEPGGLIYPPPPRQNASQSMPRPLQNPPQPSERAGRSRPADVSVTDTGIPGMPAGCLYPALGIGLATTGLIVAKLLGLI